MKKNTFHSIDQVEKFYFPKDYAERKKQEEADRKKRSTYCEVSGCQHRATHKDTNSEIGQVWFLCGEHFNRR